MPDVEDEHDARRVTTVPRLVLEGVVEYHGHARRERDDAVGDAQLSARVGQL